MGILILEVSLQVLIILDRYLSKSVTMKSVVIITGVSVNIKDLGHALSTSKAIANSEERNISILTVKRSSILEPLDSDDGDSKVVSNIHHALTEIK